MKLNIFSRWISRNGNTHHQPVASPAPVRQDEQAIVFDWIEDEKLLKDEAVLTSLAGADPALRVQTIRDYFQATLQVLDQHLAHLQEQLGVLEGKLAEVTRQTVAQTNPQAAPQQPVQQLYLRHLLGALLYTAMVAGMAVLVEQHLEPHYQMPWLVTGGLFLFGMFGMFASRSVLFTSNGTATESGREAWKVWLEEAGAPAIVAAFLVWHSYGRYPLPYVLLMGLVLFAAFTFAGRGLLSKIADLRQEWSVLMRQWREGRQKRAQLRQLRKQTKAIEQEQQQLKEEQLGYSDRHQRAGARCQTLVTLFMSEYEWGCSARTELTDRQASQLQSLGIGPARK